MIKYDPAGEVVNATVSLVLGFVRAAALSLEQEFQITFAQVVPQQQTDYVSRSVSHEGFLLFLDEGNQNY